MAKKSSQLAYNSVQIKRNLAENVKRLRLAGGHSLNDIAEACSCSEWTAYPSTIQKIEKMNNNTRLFAVYRLAVAFGTTVDKLLSTPPKNDVDAVSKKGKLSDQFDDL